MGGHLVGRLQEVVLSLAYQRILFNQKAESKYGRPMGIDTWQAVDLEAVVIQLSQVALTWNMFMPRKTLSNKKSRYIPGRASV